MNCTRAEQLIPLHTSGDLALTEADALQRHLETCVHCQQVAEEFSAGQVWLRGLTPPEFDETVFAEMRASVLQEIERTESAGKGISQKGWIRWLWPKWSPRLAFAATVALLILVSGLAFFAVRRKTSPQEVVINPSPTPGIHQPSGQQPSGQQPSPAPQQRNGTGSVSDLPGAVQATNESTGRLHSSPRHQSHRAPEAPQQNSLNVSPSTNVAAQATPGVEPTTEPARSTDIAKAEPDMLRIEFQTADPNIRIIWFAPKAGKTEPNTK